MDDLKRRESGALVALDVEEYKVRLSLLEDNHRRSLEQGGDREDLAVTRRQVKNLIGSTLKLRWRKNATTFLTASYMSLFLASPTGSVFAVSSSITCAVLACATWGFERSNVLLESQHLEALSNIIDKIWAMEQAGQVKQGTTTSKSR